MSSSLLSSNQNENFQITIFQKILLKFLKQGPIPKHVAFIPDGNRRFAKRNYSGDLGKGYQKGSDVLNDVIPILIELGVVEITFYLFSRDNYKRSEEEIEIVMKVILEKIKAFNANLEKIHEDGICFEAIGEWYNVPNQQLQTQLATLMLATKNNSRMKVNFAIGYSGRLEITEGVQKIVQGLQTGQLQLDDLSERLIQDTLSYKSTTPVDLLIRTSGETRLSDFLLWTSANAHLEFLPIYWPEINIDHFLSAFKNYQKHRIFHTEKNKMGPNSISPAHSARASKFIEKLRDEKLSQIQWCIPMN